jgi:ATP-binding cassette subfamily B protein
MRELLALEPRVRAPAQPAPWPGGALCLEDVGFGYRADAPVLHAVSVRVAPGERVAIVGPTGSGKSTIVSLLLRVRDPSTGRVTIGGVDARALDPAELRRRVGLVAQSLQLLPGTVAENLGVPPERAGQLLDALGLAERLRPETRVGEGGAPLSRGEVQLLCLARAIAEDPPFVLLDEATASMDPETEARAAQLLGLRPERAVLVVAHRLRTIVDAQRIYVLVSGRVVEVGDHPTLLARGGAYASLWRAQLAAEAA